MYYTYGASRDTVADAPKPLASFAIVARATAAEWRRSGVTEKKYIKPKLTGSQFRVQGSKVINDCH
jgi:hypothetical protein